MLSKSLLCLISRRPCQFYRNFSKDLNLNEIKAEFRGYGSGSVDFCTIRNFGIITINYHEKKNAMSGKMLAELHDVMSSVGKTRKDLSGLVLTGYGAGTVQEFECNIFQIFNLLFISI